MLHLEALQNIKNQIVSLPHQGPWLTDFIQRNQVAIQSLIENDAFGALSDFDAARSAPSRLDQVKIVLAFLRGEQLCLGHNVRTIMDSLNQFVNNTVDQQRTLDNRLLGAQMHREAAWSIQLPVSLSLQLKALNQIQILNQLEHMLNAIESESAASPEKQRLIREIHHKRAQIVLGVEHVPVAQDLYYILGAGQLSQFFRKEIQRILAVYNRTHERIHRIADQNLRQNFMPHAIWHEFKNGIDFAVDLGLTFLLPYRLGLTLVRESVRLAEIAINYVINYVLSQILPERLLNLRMPIILPLAKWLAKFFLSYKLFGWAFKAVKHYTGHQFTLQQTLGWQIFPASWSWNFIGMLAASFSLVEVGLGIALKLARKIGGFFRPEMVQPEVLSPVMPIPTGIALNSEQKRRLLILLMRENQALGSNYEIPETEKAELRKTIGAEQVKLNAASGLYFLSVFDKQLLARQRELPPVLASLESEFRNSAFNA